MIQPHGVLLGFDHDLEQVTASANLPEALHRAEGVRVGDLGPSVAAAVAAMIADPRAEPMPPLASIGGRTWHAVVHAAADVVFVELEPRADEPDPMQIGWLTGYPPRLP